MTWVFFADVRGSAALASGVKASFRTRSLPRRLRTGMKGMPMAPAVNRATMEKLL